MSDAPQDWLPEYQNFRGLATLEIIIRHVTWLGVAGLLLVPSPLREIVTTISASAFCALPQFVFISGVVLFNKYKHSFSLSTFYKKRVNTVLWPYLVFSTFYFFYPVHLYEGCFFIFSQLRSRLGRWGRRRTHSSVSPRPCDR